MSLETYPDQDPLSLISSGEEDCRYCAMGMGRCLRIWLRRLTRIIGAHMSILINFAPWSGATAEPIEKLVRPPGMELAALSLDV
jgi:hypothetical protein